MGQTQSLWLHMEGIIGLMVMDEFMGLELKMGKRGTAQSKLKLLSMSIKQRWTDKSILSLALLRVKLVFSRRCF